MEEEAKGGNSISESPLRIVFMGTSDFAVPALQKLVDAGEDVLLVVTQPDRPKGRGKKLAPPPVKVLAERLGIEGYQPEKVKSPEAVERIAAREADCLVVTAYGQLLPRPLLEGHPLGALNIHGSLLPEFRGAAPIQRAILEGRELTGVSIMLLDAGMDTGPVLSRRETLIGSQEPFGALHDRMSAMGADLLAETLPRWRAGALTPEPQDNASATYAPPISKQELRIVWSEPAHRIMNAIRAFDPAPGAFAFYAEKRLKLFGATLQPWKSQGAPGEIVGQSEEGLVVLGGDGRTLSIGQIQLEGQRRLSAGDVLRGRSLAIGAQLE